MPENRSREQGPRQSRSTELNPSSSDQTNESRETPSQNHPPRVVEGRNIHGNNGVPYENMPPAFGILNRAYQYVLSLISRDTTVTSNQQTSDPAAAEQSTPDTANAHQRISDSRPREIARAMLDFLNITEVFNLQTPDHQLELEGYEACKKYIYDYQKQCDRWWEEKQEYLSMLQGENQEIDKVREEMQDIIDKDYHHKSQALQKKLQREAAKLKTDNKKLQEEQKNHLSNLQNRDIGDNARNNLKTTIKKYYDHKRKALLEKHFFALNDEKNKLKEEQKKYSELLNSNIDNDDVCKDLKTAIKELQQTQVEHFHKIQNCNSEDNNIFDIAKSTITQFYEDRIKELQQTRTNHLYEIQKRNSEDNNIYKTVKSTITHYDNKIKELQQKIENSLYQLQNNNLDNDASSKLQDSINLYNKNVQELQQERDKYLQKQKENNWDENYDEESSSNKFYDDKINELQEERSQFLSKLHDSNIKHEELLNQFYNDKINELEQKQAEFLKSLEREKLEKAINEYYDHRSQKTIEQITYWKSILHKWKERLDREEARFQSQETLEEEIPELVEYINNDD